MPATSRSITGAAATAATAVLLWLLAFALQFATFIVTNDHFDRISRARQLARYGELPFRDFFDPGYFMTVLSAAALQRLLGDSLLGDTVLAAAGIATGAVIVLLLGRAISGSLTAGVAASLLALVALPRLYDFDKFLFYPLGILLCWRYVARTSVKNLVLLGIGLVAGALFRYDTGLYIGLAAVVTIVVVHWGAWRLAMQRLAILAAAIACSALPCVLFVEVNGGAAHAADQIVTYAQRERERTRISRWPRLSFGPLATIVPSPSESRLVRIRWAAAVDETERAELAARYRLRGGRIHGEEENRTWTYLLDDVRVENVRVLLADPRVEDTDGIDRARATLPAEPAWTRLQRAVPPLRVRILPGSWHAANGAAFLYYVLFALPVAGAAALLGHRGAGGTPQSARVLGVVAMCLALDVLILRDPIGARVGGIAGPAVVLGLWIAARVWTWRSVMVRTLLVASLALVVWAFSVTADWDRHLRSDTSLLRRLQDNIRQISASPPPRDTMPYGRLFGLVTYLRDCTNPNDRVYASWFVPELYFYAQRGFAGGMVVTFGGHWSEPRYQERSVEMFAGQSVPIAIVDTHTYGPFTDFYPALDRYLQENYRVAGETDFEDRDAGPRGYRVLVRNDRVPAGIHAASSMPCFASGDGPAKAGPHEEARPDGDSVR